MSKRDLVYFGGFRLCAHAQQYLHVRPVKGFSTNTTCVQISRQCDENLFYNQNFDLYYYIKQEFVTELPTSPAPGVLYEA
jgi:hypothetical protein